MTAARSGRDVVVRIPGFSIRQHPRRIESLRRVPAVDHLDLGAIRRQLLEQPVAQLWPGQRRLLIIAGALLLAVGMGWLALVAAPGVGHVAMIAPMAIGGIGFALALPAVTRAVVSPVAPQDIGEASGTVTG
jgi:hypothetical protein